MTTGEDPLPLLLDRAAQGVASFIALLLFFANRKRKRLPYCSGYIVHVSSLWRLFLVMALIKVSATQTNQPTYNAAELLGLNTGGSAWHNKHGAGRTWARARDAWARQSLGASTVWTCTGQNAPSTNFLQVKPTKQKVHTRITATKRPTFTL